MGRAGWVLVVALLLSSAQAQLDLPVEAVEIGRRGFGHTAGPGNVLERFEVEVLGIQFDAGLGFPLVLVRATGPVIDDSGGVAAGMSGSPVYFEEEAGLALLGAIAYVFPESDLSLALVTPIAAMRDTVATDGGAASPMVFAEHGRAASVATPILLSGLSDRASALLEPLFVGTSAQLLPVQIAGVTDADEESYRLEPGSAVSVQLARGDVTIAAVGTVTALEQGRVLAFGHPLLGSGEVSYPLATAFVSHIVPSRVVPFKLANNGRRLLGVITQDRSAAISGRLDAPADLLPITLTINHSGGSVVKRFDVTHDDRYYPVLLAAATQQAVDQAFGRTGGGSADLAWEITFADGNTINVLEQVASEGDIASAAARLAAGPLALLAGNIYEPADLARVALSISLESDQRAAEIVEVALERELVGPGDVLEVFVRLQPYRQEAIVRTLTIPIPDDIEGEFRLLFRGGDVPREGLDEDDPDDDGLPPILSFPELLARLESNLQSSELVVETVVDGRILRLERLPFPYVIIGSKRVTVTVEPAAEPDIDPGVDPGVEPGLEPDVTEGAGQEGGAETPEGVPDATP